jgi:gamma-glutamylcyclotransferase
VAGLFYLAYGSNLHPLRLMERVPSARVTGVVGIPGRSIAFHKRGADGSGKCDLVEDASPAHSHGVLYEFSSRHKAALDAVEGSGRGYDEFTIRVTLAGVVHHPYTYIAGASHIDDALRPFDWYKALVLAGARYHGFPEAYVSSLEAAPSVPDADHARAQRMEALLGRIARFPRGGAASR